MDRQTDVGWPGPALAKDCVVSSSAPLCGLMWEDCPGGHLKAHQAHVGVHDRSMTQQMASRDSLERLGRDTAAESASPPPLSGSLSSEALEFCRDGR